MHDDLMVCAFDAAPALSEAERVALLGAKGAGLAAMTEAGLPVPPGFTLTTNLSRRFADRGWDADCADALRAGIAGLEQRSGTRLGDPAAPLVVSVRAGAEVSMPGILPTVLNVGLTSAVASTLGAPAHDRTFADDTRRRAESSFEFAVGSAMPDDAFAQVDASVRAVLSSWASGAADRFRSAEQIDSASGTAVTVQAMVFGNRGSQSCSGVAFSRDPSTGARRVVGDVLRRAQGNDVVDGKGNPRPLGEMAEAWPDVHKQLERMVRRLEHDRGEVVDVEFTVEEGRLWLLQVRAGPLSPLAAIKIAVDMANDPAFPVDRAEAVRRCRHHVAASSTSPTTRRDDRVVASGVPASAGRASGVACFDPDRALAIDASGTPVILIRRATSPADLHGVEVAAGLFTTAGGKFSHAAVVAREWGIPAVVGAIDATITDRQLSGPGGKVAEGDMVTVDGDRGMLITGASAPGPATESVTDPAFEIIRQWAANIDESGH